VRYALGASLRPLVVTNIYNDPVEPRTSRMQSGALCACPRCSVSTKRSGGDLKEIQGDPKRIARIFYRGDILLRRTLSDRSLGKSLKIIDSGFLFLLFQFSAFYKVKTPVLFFFFFFF
jgi:hypothetical protein